MHRLSIAVIDAEARFRQKQFTDGYLHGLRDVFDVLSGIHHENVDRKIVDLVWARVRKLADAARQVHYQRPGNESEGSKGEV